MYGMKDILKVAGVFGIFIVICLLASGAMLIWDRCRLTKGYDERQMIHRGRGCTLGYSVLTTFLLIAMIWDMVEPGIWNVKQVTFLGILVGGMSTVTYLMLTDSWAKFNEKTWWAGPLFIVTGMLQLFNFNSFNESLEVAVKLGEEVPRMDHFSILMIGLGMIYYGLLHMFCRWWHSRE